MIPTTLSSLTIGTPPIFFSANNSHNSPIVMVGSTVIGCLAMISEILVCNTSVAKFEFKLSNNYLAFKNLITSVEVKIPNNFLAALEISASPPTTGILLKPFLTMILHAPSIGVPGVVVNTLGLI